LGREFRWFVDAGSLRQGGPQFGYAMALWIPGLLNGGIAIQTPQYVVAHYFDPAQYAIYAVACFQLPFVGILSNSISEVMLVRATEYYSQGRLVDLYDLWINGCKKALLLYIGVIGVVVSLAKPLITVLFTSRYDASVQLFAIMCLGLVFNAIFQDCIFRACSAMKTYAFFYTLRAALNVVLAFAGLKLWGLWGVALSTVVAPAIVNLFQLLPIAKLLRVPFGRVLPWAEIAKMLLAASAGALVIRLSTYKLTSATATLVTGLVLYGIVYAALAIKLQLVSRTEIFALFHELRDRFSRAPIVPAIEGEAR
jgi:O-antigen/teichoic acid export membrane protein